MLLLSGLVVLFTLTSKVIGTKSYIDFVISRFPSCAVSQLQCPRFARLDVIEVPSLLRLLLNVENA